MRPKIVRLKQILVAMVCWSLTTTAVTAGCMDNDNQFWINDPGAQGVYDKLMGLMACPLDADAVTLKNQIDTAACNYFVAKALSELYGVNDFTPANNNGQWLNANAIVDYVRAHTDTWSDLGLANDQSVLANAAQGAANGQPVIATIQNDPHGHVALVLGGDLHLATKWKDAQGNQLKVPNSAAWSLMDPNKPILTELDKSYVFCRLSATFSDPSLVKIYWRVKQ